MAGTGTSEDWKHEAQDFFEFSSEYYATEREHAPSFQAQLRVVMRALEGQTGRVLDIGCAAGGAVPALRSRGFSVVGIDYAPQMLRYARRRFQNDDDAHFVRADAECLPFPSASFDHLVCLGVLEYLPSYEASITEAARVLPPGGLVICSVPTAVSPHHLLSRLTETLVSPVWRTLKRMVRRGAAPSSIPQHHRNLCVPWRFRRLLRRHGLEPEFDAYTSYFVFPLDRLWPSGHARLSGKLEALAGVPLLRRFGCQYMVVARKRR